MTEKMVMTGKIENLERFGKAGWSWYFNGRAVRTNKDGDGLFHIRTDGQINQTAGTMQFSLPKSKRKAIGTLRKHYSVPEWQTF